MRNAKLESRNAKLESRKSKLTTGRFAIVQALLLIAAPAFAEPVVTIRNNGSSANRVDMVILGDGYTAAEIASGKYAADVETIVTSVFAQEPYNEYRNFYNVHRVDVTSAESGSDHSDRTPQVFRNTRLNSYYNCGNIPRLICVDTSAVNAVISTSAISASQRDVILVVVNDPEYGGSGG